MHNLIFRFIIEISQSTELSGTVQCITVGHSVLSTHIQSQFTVYFTEYCLHTFSHSVFHSVLSTHIQSQRISQCTVYTHSVTVYFTEIQKIFLNRLKSARAAVKYREARLVYID